MSKLITIFVPSNNLKFKVMETKIIESQSVKEVSIIGLVEILWKVEKQTFCNIVTETNVRMNKTGNPYHNKITKKSIQNVMIGTTYENRVNNNLEREEKERNFEVSENKVGEHLSKVVLYNDNTKKYYLQYERFNEVKPTVEYIFEGNEIEKKLFENFMIKSNNYSNQGTDRTVNILSVTLNNIKQITLNGQKYKVVE